MSLRLWQLLGYTVGQAILAEVAPLPATVRLHKEGAPDLRAGAA